MPVFIVEGINDIKQLKLAFPDIKTIHLHGTAFNNRVRMEIEDALERGDEVYILTDPDREGIRTAQRILDEYNIEWVQVDKDCANIKSYSPSKGMKDKYGIEYCSISYLQQLLGGYING